MEVLICVLLYRDRIPEITEAVMTVWKEGGLPPAEAVKEQSRWDWGKIADAFTMGRTRHGQRSCEETGTMATSMEPIMLGLVPGVGRCGGHQARTKLIINFAGSL